MNSTLASVMIVAFGVILAAIIAYCVSVNSQLRQITIKLTELGTQVSPLWASVQARIARDLHHPHPRYLEMDGLLEKLEALSITPHERERLKILLLERSTDTHPDITDAQREKAKLMIQVMNIVVLETDEH
jgi:hypothetical protein